MAYFFSVLSILSIISIVSVFGLPTNTSDQVVPLVQEKSDKLEFICAGENDCNHHGVCINKTVCRCDPGWIEGKDAAGIPLGPCSYKQSTKKSAFLFSIFLGSFGADWFYLSRKTALYIVVGIVKLLFGLLSFPSIPAMKYGIEPPQDQATSFRMRVVISFINLVTIVWWIVDWARILANKFPDGNGVPLLPW